MENSITASSTGALITAIIKGDLDKARELITSGKVDLDFQDSLGDTALIISARLGLAKMVILLLEEGANPNIQNYSGFTALMIAIFWNYKKIAISLIEKGADTRLKNKIKEDALVYAIRFRLDEIVKMLQEAGATDNPN